MTSQFVFRPWTRPFLFLFVLILLSAHAASAGAASPANSKARSIEEKIDQVLPEPSRGVFPGTRSTSQGLSTPSLRKRKKRRWFMPTAVAKRRTTGLARYLANQSYPEEFSDDPDLVDAVWESYGAGSCKRRGFSRVNCFWAVFSEPYDLIDEFDNVIGEDEFVCAGFLDVWYPRAARRMIKIRTTDSLCDWRSEIG